MKKITFVIMLFLVASATTVMAGKKDKKDKKVNATPVATAQPVKLATPSDTTSFAAG